MRELGCSMPRQSSVRLEESGCRRRPPILPYQSWIEQTHDAIAKIGSGSSLLPSLAVRSAPRRFAGNHPDSPDRNQGRMERICLYLRRILSGPAVSNELSISDLVHRGARIEDPRRGWILRRHAHSRRDGSSIRRRPSSNRHNSDCTTASSRLIGLDHDSRNSSRFSRASSFAVTLSRRS